jgi:hypothetical protein
MDSTESIMLPLLIESRDVLNRAGLLLFKHHYHEPLRQAVKETLYKLSEAIELMKQEEKPNWYRLYEGLCGSYVALKKEVRQLRESKQELFNLVHNLSHQLAQYENKNINNGNHS